MKFLKKLKDVLFHLISIIYSDSAAILVLIVFLIIIPFSYAFVLPLSSPFIQLEKPFYNYQPPPLLPADIINRITSAQYWLVSATAVPGIICAVFYGTKYGVYSEFKKSDDSSKNETTVNEIGNIITILYAEIFFLITITILYYMLHNMVPSLLKSVYLQPIFGDVFYWSQSTLIVLVYSIFLGIGNTYFRKDFRYYIAQKCVNVAENKGDEVKKIHYLLIALDSYNKFIGRNLRLQFDSAKVCSDIMTSDDKKKALNEIATSFSNEDKLAPLKRLSTYGNPGSSEPLLIQKKLSTSAKDISLYLASVIPMLIAVVQFVVT